MSLGKNVKFRSCRRIDVAGHAHYLTFSTWRTLPLLSRQRTYHWFIEGLRQAKRKHPFDLWAWVVMPEHVHLLIFPSESSRVSDILKAIKEPMAKRAVAWLRHYHREFLVRLLDAQPSGRHTYRFWQPGGGYDRNTWTAGELLEKIRYIHANPVRRGLVSTPDQWPWSSYRAWEEGVDEPLPIDRESLPPLEA